MLLRAYSVYDRKALQYHPPFFASTDGQAVRSFGDLANDLNTNIGRHPADFVLFLIGFYDDSNGSLESTNPVQHVADAQALVQKSAELFPIRKEA